MILVIGGKGKTGRRVAERLQERGVPHAVASRTGAVRFDWEDAATWPSALQGVEAAYVTYYPDLAFPGVSELVARFAEVAREAGVHKLVLLSGRGEDGAVASEQAVARSGLRWTVVRCNWFNQNFDESFFLESVRQGVLSIPAGDAVEPFVDADDIAEVAVESLLDARHDGHVYELSGPRALSFGEIAEELSAATGRQVVYAPVSKDEYGRMLEAEGLDAEFAELFSIILDGRNSTVTHGVQEALGRAPRDFSEYARAAAATGVWEPVAQPVG